MTPEKRANFQRLLTPRHIAFVGGTDAAIAIGEARRRGFEGQMWVVNPKRETLNGLPCIASLADLPEAPDAVFLAIPAPVVPDAITELREMGAGGIVCYTAGFGEAHDAGRILEDQLRTNLGDMALIGPNCYGVINYVGATALWPFAHGGDCPGYGAAILTQSGMFSSDITMARRSLPMAYMISAGNQADLGLAEFVDLLCDRDEVRAIGVHIEGLADVPAFERAALKALHAGTPIVALKTGNSVIGESLTLSHTGSLAGSATLYQSLFERLGIISVSNPSQFLETLKYLCVAGAPDGPQLMGFTCSGGGATMLADHAETIGLDFATPDAAAHDALTALLPPIATLSNPLDYTTPIWGQPEHTKPVFAEAMARIPGHATVLVQDYPAAGLDESKHFYTNDGLAFAEAAAEAGLPAAIIATIPENMDAETRALFISKGVAPMQGIHEALNAVRDAAWWAQRRAQITAAPPLPLHATGTTPAPTMITEAAGKSRLAQAGLPVPQGACVPAAALTRAAQDIGYPVALKMMSESLAHKTDAGAVALNITSDAALEAAVKKMRADVAAYDSKAMSDAFLIEAMSPAPLAELVVAIRRDAQFGMAMTLGSGGILVELLGDTSTVLLPADRTTLRAALDSLKVAKLLHGFRGRPKANIDALLDTLEQLAEHAIAHAGTIAEIEINPLFVYDSGVIAIDVLMQVTPE
ncbi:MAG: acetate--CoA ligase family protein [Roseovarius sp.]